LVVLIKPFAEDPIPDIDARLDAAEIVRRTVRRLPPRHREVVALRYGLVGDRDLLLREIALRLGITAQRVEQILLVSQNYLAEDICCTFPMASEANQWKDGLGP
jgi:DNA-directed RNA polymerase specialized sigma subunit